MYKVSSERLKIEDYPRTLADSTLIILFSETLKIKNIIASKSEKLVKDNNEYLGTFQPCEIDRRGLRDNNVKSDL